MAGILPHPIGNANAIIAILLTPDVMSSTERLEVGVSKEWEEVSPLPYKVFSGAMVTLNHRIYHLGKGRVHLIVLCY